MAFPDSSMYPTLLLGSELIFVALILAFTSPRSIIPYILILGVRILMQAFTTSTPEHLSALALWNPGMHPLLLFACEIVAAACLLGFTGPRSGLRLLGLLPITVLAYFIITTSKQYMRLHWASLLSGCAFGFVLHYIEIALLNGWYYENLARLFSTNSEEEIKSRDDEFERLYFGFTKTFSFRNVGTRIEAKNTPLFRNGKIPSRLAFVLEQAMLVVICIGVIDFSSAQPPPQNPAELFAQTKVPMLSRFAEISKEDMSLRFVSTIIYWFNMRAVMQGVTSLCALIAVALGVSQVQAWRPLFGSPSTAYNLRGFWG